MYYYYLVYTTTQHFYKQTFKELPGVHYNIHKNR